jgi:CDGSH-type Zn-finger protein
MADVEITVRESGPYLVRGAISVADADGNEYDVSDKAVVALCRCGQSSNKPFCDGTHGKVGFVAEERAG